MQQNSIALVFSNKIFVITVLVWILAQAVKFIMGIISEKRINFKWFVRSGGFPSSHAAGTMAMATTCGLQSGFDSVVFALAAIFALVTTFDAQGVRRAAGQQAVILNRMIDDMYAHKFDAQRLYELVGHTPLQVFIGALFGIVLAVIFYGAM